MLRKKILLAAFALIAPISLIGQELIIKPDEKGRLGYFDTEGNVVIKCQFDEAEEFVNGVARVCKDEKYGLIDVKGKYIGNKYTVMQPYSDTDLLLVALGGKEKQGGIKSQENINKAIFMGSCEYSIDGAKWGLIDRMGNVIVKPQYDELSNPINGVIYVSKGKKIGYLDKDMKEVVKPTYTFMGAFNNQGLCWVMKGGKLINGYVQEGKMGVINRNGELILQLKYASASTFAPSNNFIYSSAEIRHLNLKPFTAMPDSDEPYLWFATKDTIMPGLADISGTIIIPEKKYTKIYKPTDGMVRFAITTGKKKNVKTQWGFYDISQQKEILTDDNFAYTPFVEGTSMAIRNDQSLFYLVKKDMSATSKQYTYASTFNEGLCVVAHDGKYGAINRKGEEIIPLTYTKMNPHFSDGIIGAQSETENKWGVIDIHNKTIVPFTYDMVGTIERGFITVGFGDKIGKVDKQNRMVVPVSWKNIICPTEGEVDFFWVQKNDNLYYYLDKQTRRVKFPSDGKGYTEVGMFNHEDYAIVKQNANYGTVYKNGNDMIPCRISNIKELNKAILYMHKNSLVQFRDVDFERFSIILRGTCNNYKLSDTIPSNEWDY